MKMTYYEITVRFTLGSKEKGFYFINTYADVTTDEYKKIEAST